jgi:endoglucanase
VNQLGYLTGLPKHATLISDSERPVPFTVRDRKGSVVHRGLSQPWASRPEPTSGLNVHVLDFTDLDQQSAGYWIEAVAQRSHPFEVTSRLYDRLAGDALGFFYLMRSGTPILDSVVPGYGRPAGHAGQSPNRGDVAVRAWTGTDAERLYPGWRCEGEFDVSGGWYDAGDYGKYVTSGAIEGWQLLSTLDLLLKRTHQQQAGHPLQDGVAGGSLDPHAVPAGDPLSGMAFHHVRRHWSPMPGWAHEN